MNVHRASIRIAIGLLALLAATFPPPVFSQTADPAALFPENTIVYLARMGSDHTRGAVEDSSWGRLIAEPEVQHFRSRFMGAVRQFVASQADKNDDNAIAIYDAGLEFLTFLERHPTAFAILDARLTDHGPDIQAALVCRAGDAAPRLVKLVDQFQQLAGAQPGEVALVAGHSLTRITTAPVPVFYGNMDGLFVFAVGETPVPEIARRLEASAKEKSLLDNDSLRLCRERIGGGDASRSWTVFVNATAAFERLRGALPLFTGGDRQTAAIIERVYAAAGLDSVRSFCWEMHYRDQAVVSGSYIHTPGGGRGMFARGGPPLSEKDLALIPRSPAWAVAIKCDWAAGYRSIVNALEGIAPDFHEYVTRAIAEFEKKLGFRIDEDYLSLIGDTLVMYDTPESGGIWFTGMTAIIPIKKEDLLLERTRRIFHVLNEFATERSPIFGNIRLGLGTMQHRDHTIEFINVTGLPIPIAPAWTVHEGRLIKSFYPQMVVTALDRLMDDGAAADSILANPDVIKARKIMGDIGDSFSYVDARGGLTSAYPFVLLLAQMGTAMAQGEGIDLDIAALPSLSTLRRHLHADVGLSRADEQGILSLSYGSWPVPGTPSMASSTAATAMMVSILLPSLSRARELSKRTVCAMNMRGIGQALYISAMDRHEKFPTDINDVIKEGNTLHRMFVCPSTAITEEDVVEAIDACYIYIPGSTTSSPPNNVLLYERFENHAGEGVNVLFQDGHVEFIKDLKSVEEMIQKTRDNIAAAGRGNAEDHDHDGEDHDHDGDGVPDH